MCDRTRTQTTVLVVEDDFVLLDIVTALFQRSGIRVRSASSGEGALTILREGTSSIDWLFTDINLPGLIDGLIVAAEYRSRYPFRPIIYASTRANRPPRAVSGSIFVEKPFDPREILNLSAMMHGELVAYVGADADPRHRSPWPTIPEADPSGQRAHNL